MRNILLSILCVITILAPLSAQQTIGWRTDGSGRYPKADPPITWGLEKNVVWKTKLSGFSVATPILVGDKIFTCNEPSGLVCINKADGRILWEKQSRRDELPALKGTTNPFRDSTAGYSQCTPVSNGKQVFVMYGNSLVACHDLDGTRRWLKAMEHSTAKYGHGSSPTLVGDKLLVHYADLVALDIKDGSECWRVKIPPLHGTPIHHRIDGVDVVFSPTGKMIRVSDGKILADEFQPCGDNSPIAHDDIVYFIAGDCQALRIPSTVAKKPEPLWRCKGLKGGELWFSSPLYHDGLIYVINGNCSYSVLDARTGKIVHFDKLDFGGRVYPSITLAGKYVYVSSDNGTTIVLEPGREYKEIARNTLETFRSSPVFEGRRMYIRTQKHLWCIGE
jgi:hypothetical protein